MSGKVVYPFANCPIPTLISSFTPAKNEYNYPSIKSDDGITRYIMGRVNTREERVHALQFVTDIMEDGTYEFDITEYNEEDAEDFLDHSRFMKKTNVPGVLCLTIPKNTFQFLRKAY